MKHMFQSTHPHGVRHLVDTETGEILTVSIHAPTRGATSVFGRQRIATEFQSTHPHGVRPERPDPLPYKDEFQSTHPHGVRHGQNGRKKIPGGFNPRTHTGCDKLLVFLFLSLNGFNPRTHTGCDMAHKYLRALTKSFNPRTHTGCDKCGNRHSAFA